MTGETNGLDTYMKRIKELEAENKRLLKGIKIARAYITNLVSGQPFPNIYRRDWAIWLKNHREDN